MAWYAVRIRKVEEYVTFTQADNREEAKDNITYTLDTYGGELPEQSRIVTSVTDVWKVGD